MGGIFQIDEIINALNKNFSLNDFYLYKNETREALNALNENDNRLKPKTRERIQNFYKLIDEIEAYNKEYPAEDAPDKFSAGTAEQVNQNQIGITNVKAERYIAATCGAASCIANGLYSPKMKEAAMVHIDSLSDIRSLDKYIKSLKCSKENKLEVHLRGATQNIQLAHKILNYYIKQDGVEIKTCRLNSGKIENLAIDAESGKTYTEFSNLDLLPNYYSEYECSITRPIKCAFDHRDTKKESKKGSYSDKIKEEKEIQNLKVRVAEEPHQKSLNHGKIKYNIILLVF